MPLDCEDEVVRRDAFECFNHTILRTSGDYVQAVSSAFRSLMMAGVYANVCCSKQGGQFGFRGDLDVVSKLYGPACRVVHVRVLDVLNQGSRPPHIQRLQSIADSQNGLMQVVRVLEEQLVEIVAARIG